MDLSKLSDADLLALKSGDLSKVSTNGLMQLKGKPSSQNETYDPTEGMSGFEKGLAGVGKAFVDTGRGIGQRMGLVSPDQVAESRKYDAPLMKTGAGIAGNILGNVAMAAPTAFIPGVNTVTGGALVGAGLGAIQPTTRDESVIGNVLTGGATGAALPAVVGGYRAFKAGAYDPLVGQKNIIRDALAKSAGVQALPKLSAKTPGVKLSTGAATQNEGLAALEDALLAQMPQGALARQAQSNRDALAGAVRGVAGGPDDMASALAKREEVAGALYDAARLKGVSAESLAPEAQENIARLASRVPEEAYGKARELAKVSGTSMDNESSIQGLHWVKKALDSKISTAVKSGDNESVRAYIGLRDDLMESLGTISPEYAQGAKAFKELSQPINQMEIGGALSNRLIPATAGENPAALNYATYAKAMRDPDAVARNATGFSGAKFDRIMSPEQVSILRGVGEDVSALAEAGRRATGTNSATARRLAQGNMLREHFAENAPGAARALEIAGQIPGVNLLTKGAGMLGSVAGNKINQSLTSQIDELLATNPELVAEMIKEAAKRSAPSKVKRIASAIPEALMLSTVPTLVKQ
jgi:hypothetical protein